VPSSLFALPCTNSGQTSSYVNCVLNSGFLACGAEPSHSTCSHVDYYLQPSDIMSRMISLCCNSRGSLASKKACFLARTSEVRQSVAIPPAFRSDLRKRVKAYINNPDLFCTEH
jgi:hypothetical protein